MTYVISDIHGNKKAFDDIMNQINLSKDDKLYILGDIIDRGKYGIQLLQTIMNIPNVYFLLGNHEYMMLDALDFPYESNGCTSILKLSEKKKQWFSNGGLITYKKWLKLSNDDKKSIINYLKNLPLNYNIIVNNKMYKLVHAVPEELYDIFADEIPEESKAYFSVWERDLISVMSEVDEFITIFGHTPTYNLTGNLPMKIYYNKNIIGIDCGAAYQFKNNIDSGCCRLSCIRLDDMKEFYSK